MKRRSSHTPTRLCSPASAAFLVTIVVSKMDKSDRAAIDRAGYPEQLVRSELGRRPEKFLH